MEQVVTAEIDYGTTRDGIVQLRRQWRPAGEPRAVVYMIHGWAEHTGRYEHVGGALSAGGFRVVATDLRGYGASGGPRGHVEAFSHYLDDVEDQLDEIRGLGLPVVLLGHSMGGLIATNYCVDDRPLPDYLVLSGPALGYELNAKERILMTVGPVIRFFLPTLEIKDDGDPSLLATDPRVGEVFYADPLRFGDATVSLGLELAGAVKTTNSRLDQLSIPALCLHGGDDRLVPTESTEMLAELDGVERRVYPGLRHEIFNEPTGLEIVGEVIEWIDAQLAATEAASR